MTNENNNGNPFLYITIGVLATLLVVSGTYIAYSFFGDKEPAETEAATVTQTNKTTPRIAEDDDEEEEEEPAKQEEPSGKVAEETKQSVHYDDCYGNRHLVGTLGKWGITVDIFISKSGDVTGSYYYHHKGSDMRIDLKGSFKNGYISMDEYDERNCITGSFDGKFDGNSYSGEFARSDKTNFEFNLKAVAE